MPNSAAFVFWPLSDEGVGLKEWGRSHISSEVLSANRRVYRSGQRGDILGSVGLHYSSDSVSDSQTVCATASPFFQQPEPRTIIIGYATQADDGGRARRT